MVLTVSFVLSPATGFLVTVIGEIASANLTPASRRQDHTTSPSASGALVSSTISVHRIPPRVRDVRNAPLWGGTVLFIFLGIDSVKGGFRGAGATSEPGIPKLFARDSGFALARAPE
jgi:hypothetical protein